MNTWSKQAPMLARRTRAAAAVLEGHLYVIGGNDGDMALNSGESIDLSIDFWINQFIVESVEWKKVVKNVHCKFPGPNRRSSNSLFCLVSSPESKIIQYTFVENRKIQQILIFEKLAPTNVWHFCFDKWLKGLIDSQNWYFFQLFFLNSHCKTQFNYF